jgi:acyl carrier protein
MPKKDFADVKKEVKKLVSEITEIPEAQLKDEARFTEDLGVDSMMALEIVASIEKKYKLVIPEEKIPTVRSLQNVYDLLDELMNK